MSEQDIGRTNSIGVTVPWNNDWRQELNALPSWQGAHIVIVVVAQFNMCIIGKSEGSLATHN